MAPSRPRLRGAQARPTLPCGTPAPSAPGAAAPCGPARPACRSGLSSARREAPCMSGTNAQASREQRATEWQRYRERWSSATSGSERQVRHGRSGTNTRAMSSARSPPPPGSRALPDQTTDLRIKTGLHWGCKMSGPGVHLRLASGARGQPADPPNDPHLQAIRRPSRPTDAAVKTRESAELRRRLQGFCAPRPVGPRLSAAGKLQSRTHRDAKESVPAMRSWRPNTRQSVPPTLTAADRWPLDGEAGVALPRRLNVSRRPAAE
jgi:hypothetical protein